MALKDLVVENRESRGRRILTMKFSPNSMIEMEISELPEFVASLVSAAMQSARTKSIMLAERKYRWHRVGPRVYMPAIPDDWPTALVFSSDGRTWAGRVGSTVICIKDGKADAQRSVELFIDQITRKSHDGQREQQ